MPDVTRLLAAKAIFLRVQPLGETERIAEVDASCGSDWALREVVLLLLKGDAATMGLDGMARGSRAAMDAVLGESVGAVIGPYTVVRLIGEGGFGSVFLANQARPVRRDVALKILKAGMDTRQVVARFEQERQALAMMDHPGIAKVFDAGATPSGRPYFVMEFCTGLPITAHCDAKRLGIPQRLGLFLEVCAAIQHAHHKGIIHRDIKPENILVHEVDGRASVKVIDFGIAKATQARLTERTLATERFQLVGTLEYMSPEQAEGSLDIDTRTDVYSLGVVLYELLTGTTPLDSGRLRSAAYAEMHRIIRDTDPKAPSVRFRTRREAMEEVAAARSVAPAGFDRQLQGDLDWIAMKAIEKDRKRRYQSAGEFAEDIQRHLARQPVLAAPQTRRYRLGKFIHRHKVPVIAGAAVLLVLVAGLVGTTMGFLDANRKTRRAQYEAYVANMSSAISAMEFDNAVPAREFLQSCEPELRNWEWRFASARLDNSWLHVDHREEPLAGAGVDLHAARSTTVSASGVVRVIELPGGRVISEQRLLGESPKLCAVSADGRTVLLATNDDRLLVFTISMQDRAPDGEAPPGRLLQGLRGPITAAALDFTGHFAVAASEDGTIRTWNSGAGEVLGMIRADQSNIIGLAISDDGLRVVSTRSGPFDVSLWDVGGNGVPQTVTMSPMRFRALAFSRDGSKLVTGSDIGEATVWNLPAVTVSHRLEEIRSSVRAAALDRDGGRALVAGWNSEMLICNSATGAPLRKFFGQDRQVTAASFDLTGDAVIAAGNDGSARLWESADSASRRFIGHTAGLHSVSFSRDGSRLLSVSDDGTARVWDCEGGGQVGGTFTSGDQLLSGDLHPDGRSFAVVSRTGEAGICDSGSGEMVVRLPVQIAGYTHIAFDRTGARVATAEVGGIAAVWDAKTGAPLARFTVPDHALNSARFSPDGRLLLAAGASGEGYVWEIAHGTLLYTLHGHEQWILDGVFSTDGSRIATCSEDRTVRVWNAVDGSPVCVMRGHRGRIGGVRFSPDGSRVFSASGDNSMRVWDPRNGRLMATLSISAVFGVSPEYVLDLDISSDGTRIVTGGASGIPRIWDSVPQYERHASLRDMTRFFHPAGDDRLNAPVGATPQPLFITPR